MWLSNRDFCHGVERAVLADGIGFAMLNMMSANPVIRWDIDATRQLIFYAPQDGTASVEPFNSNGTQIAARAGFVRIVNCRSQ
jgi:NAD+ dependent glucose-6-phosphate dehydrogenase